MKRFLILFLIHSLFVQFVHSKTIGLSEFWSSCKDNHRSLQVSKEAISQANYQVRAVKSSLYPALSFSGLAQHNGNLPKIQFGNRSIQFQPDQTYRGILQANYVLYDGRRIHSLIQIQNAYYDLSKLQYNIYLSQLAYDVAKAYWNWVLSIQLEELAAKNLEYARDHFNLTEKMYQLGIVSKLDLSNATLNLEQQQLSLENAISNRKISAKTLEYLTNVSIQDQDKPKDRFTSFDITYPNDTMVSEIVLNRLEIQAQKLKTNLSQLQIKQNQANRYPNVSLFSQYSLANGSDPFDAMKFRDQWAIGVQFQYPIFQGYKTKWDIEIAKSSYHQNLYQLDEIQSRTKNELEILSLRIQALQNKVTQQKHSIAFAKDVYQTTVAKYESGQASSFETIQSQMQLVLIETQLIQAFYELSLALLDYHKLVGTIVEEVEGN